MSKVWPLWKVRRWKESPEHYQLHCLAADLKKKPYIGLKLSQILERLLTEYLGPADLLATVSERGFLSLVETSSGRVVFDRDLGHGWLWSLAFAPDGEHVATGSERGFLSLVETSSGQVVFDRDLGHGLFWSLAFAPDGEHVAAGSSSGFLSLVETSSGQVVFDRDLGHGQLLSLAFAPDGEHVPAGSDSGFLSLVETSSGQVVFDRDLGHGLLRSLAFAPKSRRTHGKEPIRAHSAGPVTADIQHRDPPAIIPEAEAAELAELQWVTWVELSKSEIEHSIRGDMIREPQPGATVRTRQLEYGEKIMLINMSRVVPEYQAAMRNGRELEPVRTALQDFRHSFRIDPPGAHIVVHPNQYVVVRELLETLDVKAHHVLLAESLTPLFLDAMKSLPSKKHVRIRRMSALAMVSEDGEEVILVERTFFCQRRRQTRSSSVSQSTTVGHGIENPRRYIRAQNSF